MSLRWLSARWRRGAWMRVRQRVRPLTTVRVADFRLTVDLNDRVLGRMLYLGGDHEPELRALPRHCALDGGVALDMGASPRELIETLATLGFDGWEFTRHRLQPIAPPAPTTS